jgi:hypothetical protein
MSKRSQTQEIRRYLKTNDHITAWVAMGVFKIMRLASRIDEIRNDLFAEGDLERIHSEHVRDARGTRYVRYRLVDEKSELYYDLDACHVLREVA